MQIQLHSFPLKVLSELSDVNNSESRHWHGKALERTYRTSWLLMQPLGLNCPKIQRKSLKMSHFWFFNFGIFHQFCPIKGTCLVTLFDRKLWFSKTRQNVPFLAFLINFCPLKCWTSLAMLNATFSVIFKHSGNAYVN